MNKNLIISLIGIPTPPGLAQTFGYAGSGRYVGFWWEHCSDDLCLSDGRTMSCGMGHWSAWKLYLEHPAVLPFLDPYFFGANDAPPTHALIIDQSKNRIKVGAQAEVISFLQKNAPALNIEQRQIFERFITGTGPGAGKIESDMNGSNASFQGIPFENTEDMTTQMLETKKDEEKKYAELQAWLDKRITSFSGIKR